MNLFVRNWIEQALRLARQQRRQPAHDVADALDLGFLATDVQYYGERGAWPFICVHVTGVRNGYGVSRQLRQQWDSRLKRGLVAMPPEARKLARIERPGEETSYDPDLLGLWDRYRRTIEYHRVVSHAGQGYRVHRLELRTPHAGPHGNDGVGFSVDQSNAEPCEKRRAMAAQDLLLETAAEMQQAGHDGPVAVTAHRCVARPSRRAQDPGAAVWRAVVMPAVARRPDLLTVDYEFRRGEGRPIPASWDPHALYDGRGRRR